MSETMKDHIGQDVQRYWFHNPGAREVIESGTPNARMQAYDRLEKEGFSDSHVLWLADTPFGSYEDNIVIDFAKLQGDRPPEEFFRPGISRIRPGTTSTTGQAEGYRFYGGDIPESAIVPKVQKRDGGPIMSPMPRGITGLSRPTGRGPLYVPRGTLPMQGGGAVPYGGPVEENVPEEGDPYRLRDIPTGVSNLAGLVAPTIRSTLGLFSKEDQDWAVSLQDLYPEGERYGGRGDAARHLAAGWLAKKADSPRLSKFLLQAHEYLPGRGPLPYVHQDYKNNLLGYEIEADTKEEAQRAIQRIIAQGDYARLNSDSYQSGGAVGPEQGGGMFLQPDVVVPAFNAADYLTPAPPITAPPITCLLYTSDAADE